MTYHFESTSSGENGNRNAYFFFRKKEDSMNVAVALLWMMKFQRKIPSVWDE